MNTIVRLVLLVLLLALTPGLQAQTNPSQVDITLTEGMMYQDTINTAYQPNAFPAPQSAFLVLRTFSGIQNKWVLTISLIDPDFTGQGFVTVQYYTNSFPPQPRWMVYNISVVPSLLKAQTDYATHDGENTITILPLENDITTGDTLFLGGIGQVQNGSASVSGDTIFFTPDDSEDAYIVYSLLDDRGSKAQGKVHLAFQTEEIVTDTLYFTLLNTKTLPIVLPFDGFDITTPPTKGSLVEQGDFALEYTPYKNSTGLDVLEFQHENGSTLRVEISIKTLSQQTSSVRDDVVYTPRDETVIFNVFENDLSSNFPINQYSTGLTYLGNGSFSYTPPAQFTGTKVFSYRVNYGTYTATAKITIFVDNCYPKQDVEYRFDTPKNIPVAVQYDMPIDGYSFSSVVQPLYGTVTHYGPGEEFEFGCNLVSSKAMFVYTPDQNYYGQDEFQVEYCIEGDQCIIYKFYLDIHDNLQDTVCHCVGADCVWPGDFDNDGFVTVKDLLSLGRHLGLSGSSRNDIAYNYWFGQVAENWGLTQKNGADVKYADANGDGVIGQDDQAALEDNIYKIHNLIPEPVLSIKDYPFVLIPNQTELDSGDMLVLTVSIGNEAYPVLDLHGLAFGLQIDPSIIDSASLDVDFYPHSWLSYANPSLQIFKQPEAGNIQTAFTRTGGSGMSGKGPVGQISLIVVDEFEGFKGDVTFQDKINSRIYTNNILFEDENGERVQVPNSFVDITIRRNAEPAVPSEEKLIVYPNPAQDFVVLHFNGRNIIHGYSLFDMFGNYVGGVENHNQQSTRINTQNLTSGMYVCQVRTSLGVITKKIQVVRAGE